jgi:hypothetical protein
MKRAAFAAVTALFLVTPTLAQQASEQPAEQQASPGQQAPANTETQQSMQPQPAPLESEPLPTACAPDTALMGSEQARSLSDTAGLEDLNPGQEQLLSALSALQIKMKSNVSDESLDRAVACALIAIYQSAQDIAEVQGQFGQDQTVSTAGQTFQQTAAEQLPILLDWLEQH